MANFEHVLPHIRRWEGNYSNHSKDKGGETYAGISRKHHPNWPGWPMVDREKLQKGGKLPWNYLIQDYNLEMQVKAFYQQYWKDAKAGEIQHQEAANIYFDLAVNSGIGRASQLLQKALNRLKVQPPLQVDGSPGPKTIAAANVVNGVSLYQAIKEERQIWYDKLKEDPDNASFYDGWIRRLSSFPDLKKKVVS